MGWFSSFLQHVTRCSYRDNEVVIWEGDVADAVYFVHVGTTLATLFCFVSASDALTRSTMSF